MVKVGGGRRLWTAWIMRDAVKSLDVSGICGIGLFVVGTLALRLEQGGGVWSCLGDDENHPGGGVSVEDYEGDSAL